MPAYKGLGRSLTRLKSVIVYSTLCALLTMPAHGASPSETPQQNPYHMDNSTWEKLIYYHGSEFKILNKNFLFSIDNPSPNLEKKLTIDAINNNPDIACQFPARYSYLLHKGLIKAQVLACPGLEEYRDKVAADKFYYIFASKNYKSITSMMGHGLIAAEGTTSSGKETSHAYSFFADLSESSLPSLLYDAFIGGVDGALVLSPLRDELDRYLEKEGRELWQLELKLSKGKRSLLKDALWELKDVEPEYLFHTFNCATLLQYTLSIVAPETLRHISVFTSPLDIYRALQQEGYINHIQIRYASDTLDRLGSNYHAVQPTVELQDSSVGLYLKDGLHLTFMGASHSFRTPQVATVSQTALKIGAIDFNLSKGRLEALALYEYLDLAIKPATSSHFFVGASKSDYDSYNELTINTSLSAGKTWQYGDASFSLLSGLRVQTKDLLNPLAEGYLSYKFNDYTTLTSTVSYQTNFHKGLQNWAASVNRRLNRNIVIYVAGNMKRTSEYKKTNFALGVNYHF